MISVSQSEALRMNAMSPKSLMTGRRSSTSLSVICWTPTPSQTITSRSPSND